MSFAWVDIDTLAFKKFSGHTSNVSRSLSSLLLLPPVIYVLSQHLWFDQNSSKMFWSLLWLYLHQGWHGIGYFLWFVTLVNITSSNDESFFFLWLEKLFFRLHTKDASTNWSYFAGKNIQKSHLVWSSRPGSTWAVSMKKVGWYGLLKSLTLQ